MSLQITRIILLLPLSSLLLTRRVDLENKTLLRNITYILKVSVYTIVLHYLIKNILYTKSSIVTIYYKTIIEKIVNQFQVNLKNKTLLRNITYISNISVNTIVSYLLIENILSIKSSNITIYYKTIIEKVVNQLQNQAYQQIKNILYIVIITKYIIVHYLLINYTYTIRNVVFYTM